MEMKILTGYEGKLDEVKKEILQKSDYIHSRFTYPNGLILEFEQFVDGTTTVNCNKPLQKISENIYKPII